MRNWVTLAITFAMLAGAVTLEAAGKHYALIIGVKKYHPQQPLPELTFTENDASGLAAVLKDGGYKVILMTQAEGRIEGKEALSPQVDNIQEMLGAVLENPNLDEDDVVIVALAGHGVQYELVDGDKKFSKFYFCPSDAKIEGVVSANEINRDHRLIDLQDLYRQLDQCKAGGKLLLVDACRNDPSKPSVTRSTNSRTLPPLPAPPGGTIAFFSCSAHQRAFEDKDLKHGVFFHHVIEALKGDADTGTAKKPADGQIDLIELQHCVATATYDFVLDKYPGARQLPELKGDIRGSISLIKLAKNPMAAEASQSSANLELSAKVAPQVKGDASAKPIVTPDSTVKSSTKRPYFGSIPDFGIDKPGYGLAGASPGSPADKAGMKAGDRIIQIQQARIENLEDFDQVLRKFSPGAVIEVTVVRDEKEVKLKVTLDKPR